MKDLLKKRPLNRYDYLTLLSIFVGAVVVYVIMYYVQSASCEVSGVCQTTLEFNLIRALAYFLLSLGFLHAMYLRYIAIKEERNQSTATLESVLNEPKPVEKAVEKEPTRKVLEQKAVVFDSIEDRPKYKPNAEVENGYYCEIDDEYRTSNFVVEVQNGTLPELLNPVNVFIPITNTEYEQLSLKNVDMAEFVKFTPGSYVEGGYYVEVDLGNKSTERYIFTERRLPPTSRKGYRWVKVTKRSLK